MEQQSGWTVCVYCASSGSCDPVYHEAASLLGESLAAAGCTIVYGGSRNGSMGALANGALSKGGRVVGVLPRFLQQLEIEHASLSELHIVDDMRMRKHRMLTHSDAVVALPGGCGTFEELLEAISLKRLGLYLGPIIIVNVRDYYAPLLALLNAAVDEKFMAPKHRDMWTVVDRPDEVLPAMKAAPRWSESSLKFAVL
ncbi:MAG: TIGR00730 family Rossman fold protein [Pseudomonadota bacterium]